MNKKTIYFLAFIATIALIVSSSMAINHGKRNRQSEVEVKAESEPEVTQAAVSRTDDIGTVTLATPGQEFYLTVIIDNTSEGFSTEGKWVEGYGRDPYGENYLVTRDSPGTATWETTVPKSTYNVYVKWLDHSERNPNAAYFVNGNMITVDQRMEYDWFLLGSFELDGEVKIVLNGSYVCADAVAISNQY